MSPLIIILLGRSGSGKGTQVELLRDKLKLIYIGSGELLRERTKTQDFTGKKADVTMRRGDLVPTTLIFMLWINLLEKMKQTQDDNFEGLIFDGSPRELDEAQLLDEALIWYEWNRNIRVLLIDISRQEGFDRLTRRRICKECDQLIPYIGDYKKLDKCDKCGGELVARPDDTVEAINNRLDFFEREVVPVIDFYEKKGVLTKINGEQSIEQVHQEILEKLNRE